MNEFSKISYYDLRLESSLGKLKDIVGRKEESDRLSRIISRKLHNNALIIGPSGTGKSAFIHAWIKQVSSRAEYKNLKLVQLSSEGFFGISNQALINRYQEAIDNLPSCVLIIDDFGSIVNGQPSMFENFSRLMKSALNRSDVHVVLVLKTHEHQWLSGEYPSWMDWFETLQLKPQPQTEQVKILHRALERLNRDKNIGVSDEVLDLIVNYVKRFGSLGNLPSAGINILDESLAQARFLGSEILSEEQVTQIIADKTGVPLSQLKANELEILKNLDKELSEKIIGQVEPLGKIVATIQRARLGLRNPDKPLASFLVLGPSGVGKTETAKVLAEKLFGKKESFLRIDMSEFGQEHMVQRLLGAPPGYVGYSEGGELTRKIKQEPYSLILLDEIEKAHPKAFDIFLQILDDGRLTSGTGETVDFTQTVIMATSNLAVDEILAGVKAGANVHHEEFYREYLVPKLTSAFRPEFINRFDSVLVFNPLGLNELVNIAQLEIKKIEERVKKHKIKFKIENEVLAKQLINLTDPRFGARPVKRFIEETCETLITKALLNKNHG